MISDALYDPDEHRPLTGEPWSESESRAAIERIARDAIHAYQGPERLWSNAPEDLEDEPDVPCRNVYFGAAGVAWALDRLARDGVGPVFAGAHELARTLHEQFLRAPELTSLEPPPAASLLFGESGILLAAEAMLRDGSSLPALEACVSRNAENPSLELCWGSPGTMIAANELWRTSREELWKDLWRASADRLLSEWRERVWVQDLYGTRERYVGAGHGFAGNAFALLSGSSLLGEEAAAVIDRIRAVLVNLAWVQGELAQWPALASGEGPRRPVQWCHGSPGMVTSLAGLPRDEETDRLLSAGGELTWLAGPLRKSPGLCHGTAGNAYAFLALFERFGDEVWLDRARAFAMDAIATVDENRAANGHGRYSLYTGDVGVAVMLEDAINGAAGFPFLERTIKTT